MQPVFDIVMPVFAIILAGYLAGRFRVLGAASAEALNRFVFYIAMPPLLFIATARVEAADLLRWGFIGAYLVGLLLTFILAIAGARFLFGHRQREMAALHGMAAVFANAGFVGIPLFLAAFGPERLLPAVLATVATNIVLVGCVTAIIETARRHEAGLAAALGHSALAVIRSPLFVAPVAGMVLSALALGPGLPQPVVNFCELLGGTAAPGALFALGLSLVGHSLNVDWAELGWIVIVKLVIHPLLTLGLVSYVFTVDPFWAKSAVLLAAMPSAVLVYVMAQTYDIYVQRASAAIVATTVLSMITLSWLLITF